MLSYTFLESDSFPYALTLGEAPQAIGFAFYESHANPQPGLHTIAEMVSGEYAFGFEREDKLEKELYHISLFVKLREVDLFRRNLTVFHARPYQLQGYAEIKCLENRLSFHFEGNPYHTCYGNLNDIVTFKSHFKSIKRIEIQ